MSIVVGKEIPLDIIQKVFPEAVQEGEPEGEQKGGVRVYEDYIILNTRDPAIIKRWMDWRDKAQAGETRQLFLLFPKFVEVGRRNVFELAKGGQFIDALEEGWVRRLSIIDSKAPIYIVDTYEDIYPTLKKYFGNERNIKEYAPSRFRMFKLDNAFRRFVTDLEVDIGLKNNVNFAFRPSQISTAFRSLHQHGLIIAQKVGSGKTLAALLSAVVYAHFYPAEKIRVNVVAVKATVQQWKNEVSKLPNEYHKMFSVYGHDQFVNESSSGEDEKRLKRSLGKYCHNAFLIVDEAHVFRTEINWGGGRGIVSHFKSDEELLDFLEGRGSGKKAAAIVHCARYAKRVVLLTGTPLVNRPEDLFNLITMVLPPGKSLSRAELKSIFGEKNPGRLLASLRAYLQCYFSFAEPDISTYPNRVNRHIWFDMDRNYLREYVDVEREEIEKLGPEVNISTSNKFYNAIRQASNKISNVSPKVQYVINKVHEILEDKDSTKRIIINSPFKGAGIEVIMDILEDEGFEYGKHFRQITGDITQKPKLMRETIDWYNDPDISKPRILFLTKAGEVGLDFKRTSAIFLIQPNWNASADEQLIARGVRAFSHSDVKNKTVEVYHLFLKKPREEIPDVYERGDNIEFVPSNITGDKKVDQGRPGVSSADIILFNITERKKGVTGDLISVLKELDKDCIETRGIEEKQRGPPVRD
jgi:hypothetical protein